jgi:uncharacterized damage-inducible protein DinB
MLLAAIVVGLPCSAPTALRAQDPPVAAGIRGDMLRDVGTLETKYLSLAEAMPASTWDWRPMEGVRSVGEVYRHVADANFGLPRFIGVEAPSRSDAEETDATDPAARKAATVSALRDSFAHLRDAIRATPDDALDRPTQVFGEDSTYRAALLLMVTHLHEHLGQAVAYARSNGVVPPWSAGG